MKNYFKSLFSFSRKELNGILVLSGLLFLFIISHPIVNWLVPEPATDLSAFYRDTARFVQRVNRAEQNYSRGGGDALQPGNRPAYPPRPVGNKRPAHTAAGPVVSSVPETYFLFDPNTVTLERLLQLGLEKRVAVTLLNYRKAGGRFYKKEDLMKVYGMEPALYQRLIPYIRIGAAAASEKPGQTNGRLPGGALGGDTRRPGRGYSQSAVSAKEKPLLIALNTADSAALLPLPGIGPVLSARIVKYRERLGGFHSVCQLLEVYGLDTPAFQKIRPQLQVNAARVKKIALNTAGYEELRRLPYWTSGQVSAVLNYRRQRGGFSSLDELHEILALEKHIIQKVMPYLSLENTNQ